MKATDQYAILYTGAPYGVDEAGEILSTHPTEESARIESRTLNSQPDYYGSIRIVELDDPCKLGCTYREWVSGQSSH